MSNQHHSQDELGQYTYGYSNEHSSKVETKTADGITRGSYSYVTPDGQVITNNYVSDYTGFKSSLAPSNGVAPGYLTAQPAPVPAPAPVITAPVHTNVVPETVLYQKPVAQSLNYTPIQHVQPAQHVQHVQQIHHRQPTLVAKPLTAVRTAHHALVHHPNPYYQTYHQYSHYNPYNPYNPHHLG